MFASCTSADKDKKQTPDTTVANTTTTTSTTNTSNVVTSDSIEVPPFGIQVQLSDKAERTIQKRKETIIVMAFFMGTPKDTTSKEYLESGEKSLGSKAIELKDERTAKFAGIKMAKKDVGLLTDSDYRVLINIYSGRKSSENNLLDCDILEDPISKVKNKTHVLKGKLIGE